MTYTYIYVDGVSDLLTTYRRNPNIRTHGKHRAGDGCSAGPSNSSTALAKLSSIRASVYDKDDVYCTTELPNIVWCGMD